MGKDGFQWFVGVVEDRNDPQKLGRLKVRCLGYHTRVLNKLPTADLPWASPVLPITSSGISGIGQTPLGLVEGSFVEAVESTNSLAFLAQFVKLPTPVLS